MGIFQKVPRTDYNIRTQWGIEIANLGNIKRVNENRRDKSGASSRESPLSKTQIGIRYAHGMVLLSLFFAILEHGIYVSFKINSASCCAHPWRQAVPWGHHSSLCLYVFDECIIPIFKVSEFSIFRGRDASCVIAYVLGCCYDSWRNWRGAEGAKQLGLMVFSS